MVCGIPVYSDVTLIVGLEVRVVFQVWEVDYVKECSWGMCLFVSVWGVDLVSRFVIVSQRVCEREAVMMVEWWVKWVWGDFYVRVCH